MTAKQTDGSAYSGEPIRIDAGGATVDRDFVSGSIVAVFSLLLAAWPVRIEFQSNSVIARLETRFQPPVKDDVYQVDQKYVRVIRDVILWLVDEGYVRTSIAQNGIQFSDCVLTEKGLRLLNSIPESLKEKQTAAQIISKNVKETTSDTLKAQASSMIGELIAGFVRSIS